MPEENEAAREPKKVLVVEDNPDILESLEILLLHHGYRVSTVDRGDQVKGRVHQFKPDLIIMDVMIPKPDGVTLCRDLKSDPQTRGIPVMMLSAKAQKGEIEEGISAGAERYLAKPYRNDQVLRAVAELLSGSR